LRKINKPPPITVAILRRLGMCLTGIFIFFIAYPVCCGKNNVYPFTVYTKLCKQNNNIFNAGRLQLFHRSAKGTFEVCRLHIVPSRQRLYASIIFVAVLFDFLISSFTTSSNTPLTYNAHDSNVSFVTVTRMRDDAYIVVAKLCAFAVLIVPL